MFTGCEARGEQKHPIRSGCAVYEMCHAKLHHQAVPHLGTACNASSSQPSQPIIFCFCVMHTQHAHNSNLRYNPSVEDVMQRLIRALPVTASACAAPCHAALHTEQCPLSLTTAFSQVPEALDFGLTPVKGQNCHTLTVHNSGDAAVQCSWEVAHPFSITPGTASIDAGQAADFECSFQPPEASVYTVLAACHADTGYTATVKVCYWSLQQA